MPPPSTRKQIAPVPKITDIPELESYKNFIQQKTDREELRQLFYSELEMGLVTMDELVRRKEALFAAGRGQGEGTESSMIKGTVRERIQFEIMEHITDDDYRQALDKAVAEKNYEFDTGGFSADFYSKISDYKEDDIVFFVKRSTTVKLDVPCRNCGKKELFMEQPKQTARADEQIVKYARCANCQMRMNAQWLL